MASIHLRNTCDLTLPRRSGTWKTLAGGGGVSPSAEPVPCSRQALLVQAEAGAGETQRHWGMRRTTTQHQSCKAAFQPRIRFWRPATAHSPRTKLGRLSSWFRERTSKSSPTPNQQSVVSQQPQQLANTIGQQAAAFSLSSFVKLRQAGFVAEKTAEQHHNLASSVGLVLFPSWLLPTAAAILEIPEPIWVPLLAGATLGGLFAALNRYRHVRVHVPPSKPLSVVITGGSKGLGKALAREMLLAGDRVLVTSRTRSGVDQAVNQLKAELGPRTQVWGTVCDVSDPDDVATLETHARLIFGTVDVWINNAGYSGSFQPFTEAEPEQIEQVVGTNLLGTMICSRQAVRLFAKQPGGGHLFNVDGAGADGFPTPSYAAYGATKAGIRQLSLSLQEETRDMDVKVHLLSPGMILTDLLLEGASVANKQAFNILCEQPETAAAFLAPRIRTVVARNQRDAYVKYLTVASALWRLITAPARINKFFDSAGQPLYMEEAERLFGRGAKATARSIAAARRLDGGLRLAYSLSLAFAVAVLVLDAGAGGAGAGGLGLGH